MKFPTGFFEIREEEANCLVYMNIDRQINCILNFAEGESSLDLGKSFRFR